MHPHAHPVSNALNALLPPPLCQRLLAVDQPGDVSAETRAHWQTAHAQLEQGKALLLAACQDPAMGAHAARLVQLHAGFAAAGQILERRLRALAAH